MLLPRPPSQSQVEMTQLVLPGDTNALGTAFGGKIMQWIDIAAAVAARRHSDVVAVTASMDGLSFARPLQQGDVVVLRASVNRAWKSSMEVGVLVEGETIGGARFHAATAYLTFVALGPAGERLTVPAISAETNEQRRRYAAAQVRREQRLRARAARRGQGLRLEEPAGPAAETSGRARPAASPAPAGSTAPTAPAERETPPAATTSNVRHALISLLGRVAHDLKNPLAVVLANLRFMEGNSDDPDFREAAEESAIASERMARMLDDLAEIDAWSSGTRRPVVDKVDLKQLVAPVEDRITQQLGSRRLELAVDSFEVSTDPALLSRALTNIVEHSIRRIPGRGVVRVTGQKTAGGFELCVTDEGPPFDPADTPSFLNEDVPTAKDPAPGFRSDQGLGLYFAGIAARALGATLRVDERTDQQQGVVFRLSFRG